MSDAPARSPSRPCPWVVIPAALVLPVALFTSWADTWMEYFKVLPHAWLAARVQDLNVFVGITSVLLFAFGVRRLTRRAWLDGALACASLLVWSSVLLLTETWVSNQIWILIYLAPLNRIYVFGS